MGSQGTTYALRPEYGARGSAAGACCGVSTSGIPPAAPVIYVVDDDPTFRTAVGRLLRASGYRVALYASAHQLLEDPPTADLGCVFLDLRMPDVGGLELQDRLTRMGCTLPILFLTGHADIPASVRAIKCGAEDFLCKPVSKDALFDAVKRALMRHAKAREHQERIDGLRALVASLTPREHEVFALAVRGKLNKQIAYELGTSERTIKAHRRSIKEKLHVGSLAEAVSIAERLGMLAA